MTPETSSAEKLKGIDYSEVLDNLPKETSEATGEQIPEAAMEAIRQDTTDFLQGERDRITQEAQAAEQEILDPEKRTDVIQANQDVESAQAKLAKLAEAIDSGNNETALDYLVDRKNELGEPMQAQEQAFNTAQTDLKEYNIPALQSELEDINTKQQMDIYTDVVGEEGQVADEQRKEELSGMLRDVERYNQDVDTIADRLNRAQEIENQVQAETNESKKTELGFEAKDLRDRAQVLKDKFKDADYNKYGEAADRVADAQIAMTELQNNIDAIDRTVEGVQSAIEDDKLKKETA